MPWPWLSDPSKHTLRLRVLGGFYLKQIVPGADCAVVMSRFLVSKSVPIL